MAMPAAGPSPALYPPEDIEQGKTWALLGYLISPLWVIPFVQRDNAFALYHAKQSLALLIAVVIASIPISIIGTITCGIGFILYLPFMYPWIIGVVNSAQGQYKPVPWFGFISDKYLATIQADKRPVGPPR